MNKNGFINVVLVVSVVVILMGGLSYIALTQNSLVSQDENLKTSIQSSTASVQGVVSSTDITTDWKIYRNDQYGFEFKYPPEINGKRVEIRQEKNFIGVFIPKISYGSSTVDKGDKTEAPVFSNPIQLFVNRLTDYVYPGNKGGPTLTVGVDLGGQGGYIYNPDKALWYSGDDRSKEFTWEEMYKYFESVADKAVLKTVSNQKAFPYRGAAYESYWNGYHIFDTSKQLYIALQHTYFGVAPQGIKPEEIDREKQAIEEFLVGAVKTLKID